MTVSNLNRKSGKKEFIREEIDIATVAKIVDHGNRFYLSIRKADVEWWDLYPGLWVHLKIDKVKRPIKNSDEWR